MGPDTSRLYRSAAGHAAMMAWYDAALARLPVPVESCYVGTRYGQTHALVCGPQDAPPLVLVAGMGGNALMWQHQITRFANRYRLYALDVIGQTGRSAPTRPSHHGPAYALWLGDVFDAFSLRRADVAGSSMGARIVLKFGAHPAGRDRIRRAVLLSPAGLVRIGRMRGVRPVIRLRQQMDGDLLARMMRRFFCLPEEVPLSPDVMQALEGFRLFLLHYRQGGSRGMPIAFPLPDRVLRSFLSPTMLLIGEQDRLFNPFHVIARAWTALPNLKHAEIIPNAGHSLLIAPREDVNHHIAQFLDHAE